MSQHDYVISDQNGLSFLADLNAVLAAIVGNNSGATEPATPYAYMLWADTANGLLKQRNAANNAWISLALLSNFALPSVQTQLATRFTAAGTNDAITGALAPVIAAYSAGLRITTKTAGANTVTAPTINLNSLGNKTIKKRDSSGTKVALAAGDYNASGPFDFEYDGVDFILLNPVSQALPAGTIIDFAGTSPPEGFLTCPTSLTYISATTYKALALAIGGQWGAGSVTVNSASYTIGNTYIIKAVGTTDFTLIGATANTVGLAFTATGVGAGTGSAYSDFVLPWFAANYSSVQANANVGSTTVGQVIAHTHTGFDQSAGAMASGLTIGTPTGVTGSTGGSANLAAGVRVLKCIKY